MRERIAIANLYRHAFLWLFRKVEKADSSLKKIISPFFNPVFNSTLTSCCIFRGTLVQHPSSARMTVDDLILHAGAVIWTPVTLLPCNLNANWCKSVKNTAQPPHLAWLLSPLPDQNRNLNLILMTECKLIEKVWLIHSLLWILTSNEVLTLKSIRFTASWRTFLEMSTGSRRCLISWTTSVFGAVDDVHHCYLNTSTSPHFAWL